MAKSIEDKIIQSIYGHGRGWAFSAQDFLHYGSRGTIDTIIGRLAKKKKIRRVIRVFMIIRKMAPLFQENSVLT